MDRPPSVLDQKDVDAYFESAAAYWRDVYQSTGTQAEVYRDRYAGALAWIDAIAAAQDARALDVGCGAGFMAADMVLRGYRVEAIDRSQAMVDLARRRAASAGVSAEMRVDTGDVCALAFPDASFDLVVALAVLPWLRRAEPAIAEMARVTKPGGHVILTADNRARLNTRLDPKYNLTLAPLRDRLMAALVRLGLHRVSRDPKPTFHRRGFIDQELARVGLVKVKSRTIGFGPFSVLGHVVVPEPFGTHLHRRLQRLADQGVPGLRSTGGHYLVLARKTPAAGTRLAE